MTGKLQSYLAPNKQPTVFVTIEWLVSSSLVGEVHMDTPFLKDNLAVFVKLINVSLPLCISIHLGNNSTYVQSKG